MKNIISTFLLCLFVFAIQAQPFLDENDECSDPAAIGGFGPTCTLTKFSSTMVQLLTVIPIYFLATAHL